MVRRVGWALRCGGLVIALLASPQRACAESAPLEETPPPAPTAQSSDRSDVESGAESSELVARRVFDEGVRAIRAARWSEAEWRFRESLARFPRATARYDLAFVLFKLGRPRESLELLDGLSNGPSSADDATAKKLALVLLPRVLAELSTLRVLVAPPAAEVRVDGSLVSVGGRERSLRLLPGEHHVRVDAPGFTGRDFAVRTTAGAEVAQTVVLAPLLEQEPSGQRPGAERDATPSPLTSIAPWILVGLGGAALAGGVVTGIVAKNADDEVTAACPSRRNCDPGLIGARDRAARYGRAADVLLVGGGVFVVGGAAWAFLVRPSSSSAGGHSAGVTASGQF